MRKFYLFGTYFGCAVVVVSAGLVGVDEKLALNLSSAGFTACMAAYTGTLIHAR